MRYLKIETLPKGEWADPDTWILHSSFQVLVNFIEKDNVDMVDWNGTEWTKHAWKEAKALYKWWTVTRPNRSGPLDKLPDNEHPDFTEIFGETEEIEEVGHDGEKMFRCIPPEKETKKVKKWRKLCKKQNDLEGKWFEEDQKNLHRLINIRQYLWV